MRNSQEEAALAVVDRFKTGWQQLDGELILSLFHDDAVMQSMMKEPCCGKTAIKAMLDGFLAIATRVEMEVLNRCVENNVVTFERRDHFTVRGKSGTLPAVGIFEVENGRIRTWREYYDWNMYERQIADMPHSATEQAVA